MTALCCAANGGSIAHGQCPSTVLRPVAHDQREEALEIESIEWNPYFPLSEELKKKIIAVITWQLRPDFSHSRSGYLRLPEVLAVAVETAAGRKTFEIPLLKLKNIGDFHDASNPTMPGADVPGYLQHEVFPEVHPEIDAECYLHPVMVPPIPRGSDRYRFNLREYAHTGEALFRGADVGIPFAVIKYKGRAFRGDQIGALVLGCFEEQDRRFAHLFNGAVLELDHLQQPVLTLGEYARSVVPHPDDMGSILSFMREGIGAWGDATRDLTNIGVLHASTHPFNVSYVKGRMYYHDFIETKWNRDFTPEQAFLYQLTWPITHAICGLELLLLQTDLGPPLIMMYHNAGENPYKDWLRRYFRDADVRTLRVIDHVADELFDKAVDALMKYGQTGISFEQYAQEREMTYMIASVGLFPALESIQQHLGLRAPYSQEEYIRRFALYKQESLELANRWRGEHGLPPLVTQTVADFYRQNVFDDDV